jgi:hypothetical protein
VDADRAEDLVTGTNKHFTNAAQVLAFAGGSFTVSQVTAKIQTIATLRSDTEQAQATAKAKVAAETAQLPALMAFMTSYVAFVKVTFGNAPDVLADFGLEPKKAPTPPTAETKVAAVAKRAATRTARGTKGSVQKQSVKGNVTGVVVTPVTATAPAPASPQPAAAPATGSSSGTGTAPHS